MKTNPIQMRFRRFAAAGLALFFVGACAGTPSLDDAEVTALTLATPAEISSFEAAKDLHLSPSGLPSLTVIAPDWPTLRLAFQSQRQLFNPLEAGRASALVYPCTADGRDRDPYGLGSEFVLWRGRVVDQQASQKIADLLASEPTPQEYVVFFDYRYWDVQQQRDEGDPITLLPLQDDLCLSLHKPRYPFAPSVGEPLRISKDSVNTAVGDLPRSIPAPQIPVKPILESKQ